VLVIHVVERPIIGVLRINGNKLIKTKDLTKVLNENGIGEGLVYDAGKVQEIKMALEQQYYNQGRYNAHVNVAVKNEVEGRVSINIDIFEGDNSTIKQIRILGNHAYNETELLKHFKLTKHHLWTRFTGSDQYSREKLNADIESMRSFYMDKGYINFHVESVQVSITPDKKDVHITINIDEGPVFRLRSYRVEGDIDKYRAELEKYIKLKKGQPFSRKDIVNTNKMITEFFEDSGYAFAKVDMQPDVDMKTKQVDVVFIIQPGKYVYIRNIAFAGNTKTQDNVLRRALRQFEGALYSEGKLALSKRNIDNLGYVEKVTMEKHPVPGKNDQMDVVYKVTETSTASAQAQFGYSDAVGFTAGAGISEKNFLGSGRAVGIQLEKNSAYGLVNLSYYNPYLTVTGIGHGYNFYYNKTTPGRVGVAKYSTDTIGVDMHFSLPIAEFNYLSLSLGYNRLNFHIDPATASAELITFVKSDGTHCDPADFPPAYLLPPIPDGLNFDSFMLTFGWTDSNLNRAVFPTEGYTVGFSAKLGLPVTSESISIYQATVSTSYYLPLYHDFIFHMKAKAGYGDGYGRMKCMPFFLNYHAGGIDTVRGLDDNTLGPKDSTGRPLGGNVIGVGNFELITPTIVADNIRTRVFVDVGNVFNDQFVIGDLRVTGGVQVDWISPFGPLRCSLGYPLVRFKGEEPKMLQFSLGTSI
ncbi:MAG: outer membrane protein assembly factor BamA, partial [Coxiellaceae bacterium]|nr:outer membrane protein assembly factor BamA [Coxiellaceae bacterium]